MKRVNGQTPRSTTRRVAVVGAGMAGVACARTLLQAGCEVTLIEQFDQVGGRMATESTPFGDFDTGAQYFTVRDARFRRALKSAATPKNLVLPWDTQAVRSIDATGCVVQPDSRPDEWWVGAPRMSALLAHWAQPIQATPGSKLLLGSQVVDIKRDKLSRDKWQLSVAKADRSLRVVHGFDAVLFTPPPEVTRELLATVSEAAPLCQQLVNVRVAPCWTLTMAFPQASQPGMAQFGPTWGAAHSRHHRLSWLSRESTKPGREGVERWTVQSSAEWAAEHTGDSPERIEAKLTRAFTEITGIRAQPSYASVIGWRWARTVQPLGSSHLWSAAQGLGLAGDWCLGHRVEDAFVSGLSLALAVLKAK